MKNISNLKTIILPALFLLFAFAAQAQTTAFNFQGRLNDGTNPANGRYDLQFKLYDAIAGGNPVGATVGKPNLMLINGVFSTALDFGATAFSGGDRFLEISLRQNGSTSAYVILGARQQILSVPYAAKSLNASNSDNATNSQNAVNAQNAASASFAENAGTAFMSVSTQNVGSVPASRVLSTDANGNISFSGNVGFQKNVSQATNAFGLVKAMAYIEVDGTILRCFNSTLSGSAATTLPCGITVNHFTAGGYGMNFGFPVTNSFFSVSIHKGQGFGSNNQDNGMIRWEQGNTGNVDVRTAKPGDDITTSDYPFMIIVY